MTCFSTSTLTIILGGKLLNVRIDRATAKESDSGSLVSTRIFTIPMAARRKANGSLDPEGINPTAKQPTKESSLSASATAWPVMFRGMESSRAAGL
jgi:hypothetical protein